MCLEEESLKEIWISLFQAEMCSKVKDLNVEIVGPFMLIEQTSLVFKEISKKYVNCLKEVDLIKTELSNSNIELKSLREKLNETRKPCGECESLHKELMVAKERAKNAEFRVSQIANIITIPTSKETCLESKDCSPSRSPKRKRYCNREKNESTDDSNSSQIVEIGCDKGQTSPSTKENLRRLSRSADLAGSFEKLRVSPRRNLSAEFTDENAIQSPRKRKKSNLGLKNYSDEKIHDEKQGGNDFKPVSRCVDDSFAEFSNRHGAELDKLWFSDDNDTIKKGRRKNGYSNAENKQSRDGYCISESNPSRTGRSNEGRKVKPSKNNTILKSNNVILNTEKGYDLILEKKKPKKKFKQLTLQIKPSNKNVEEVSVESDQEDIILPSPDKFANTSGQIKNLDEDLFEDCFAPGATSTQKPIEDLNSTPEKRTPVKPKKKTADDFTSKGIADNSFDVIIDKKKALSPNFKYKGKTVRGKARANLEGWECEECRKFYELACKNLSPSKAKSKMNYCSRHRSKFKQTRPPTPPGFWDIDIPDTP